MSTTAAGNQQRLRSLAWHQAVIVLVLAVGLLLSLIGWLDSHQSEAPRNPGSFVLPHSLGDLSRTSQSRETTQTVSASLAFPFAALAAQWESVWSIDIASAERNEANIDRARDLRILAEEGDLDAVVELIGAASWCASAGPLASQRDNTDGTRPPPCSERFGADIASHQALEWAIFRWTMMLANAGFQDATLYASVRGRDLLFAASSATDPELAETLRSQLIGQLQSMASTGSADAASELNSYYMRAVETSESGAEQARFYARLTEQLDPTRSGLVEVTDDWIVARGRLPS